MSALLLCFLLTVDIHALRSTAMDLPVRSTLGLVVHGLRGRFLGIWYGSTNTEDEFLFLK